MSEHIVILGGGFGGWYAAKALARGWRAGHRITLIDRVNHMLYTPMLTEVAGGNLPSKSVAVPMGSLPRRVQVRTAEIAAVDVAAKTVRLGSGEVIQATQLVFALGSTTSYHDIEGAKENSIPLKTLADAEAVRAKVQELVRAAKASTDAAERRRLLTVVVAGGGYTGVETIAAVGERLAKTAAEAGLPSDEVSTVLIEPSDRLMHETPEPLARYSKDVLEQTGIRVMLKNGVKSVTEGSLTLTNGEQIHAGLLIWDTGIEPSPLLKTVNGLPMGKHHGVTVNASFQVEGLQGVWAIGDCAEIPQQDGKPYAPTAQNATREGAHLAQNISAVLRGDAPRPFRFTMLGQLALLNEKKAVAEILGVQLRGTLAWAMWWAIYTVKLPWMPGRVAVLREMVQ